MGQAGEAITIRAIGAGDIDACWTLRLRALRDHPEAFGQPYADAAGLTVEQVHDQFDTFWTGGDNQVFVAARPDGALAGMIGIARERRPTTRHRAAIWGVYVAPEARGRGVAGKLLDAAITWCRSRDGVLQIHLQVATVNPAAFRVYARAGFVHCGYTPRARIVEGEAIDHAHMVLMLDHNGTGNDERLKGPAS